MFIMCLKRLKVAHLVLKQSKVAPDTKVARGCSKGKKLLKTPKVAHKLPSTIYKGLVKVPFQFKGLHWRNSELSEMLVQFF